LTSESKQGDPASIREQSNESVYQEKKMNEAYIILAMAIGIPIIAFALTPYIASMATRSRALPKVSDRCFKCLGTYGAGCEATCSL
jgi:hypothetical protein